MKKNIVFIILSGLLIPFGMSSQSIANRGNIGMGNRTTDSLALVEFNRSTSGVLWKQTWDFTRPIEEWFGVKLNNEGRVFCLDLDGDPNCTASRYGGNHLHGNLPDLQLPFLEHLFLSSNKIEGQIPNFSNIPYLRTLQLSANRFSGAIPSLDQLAHLIKIDLEYNELCGVIPNFEIPTKLEAIYLGHNNLKGGVPDFENTINLKQIYMDHNHLNACPEDFSHLHVLQQLILCHNNLSGSLPYFAENRNLIHLDLSNNKFNDCFITEEYNHIKYFNFDNNLIAPCSAFKFFIPNAFSPNGDGINDYFELKFSTVEALPRRIGLQVWSTKWGLVYENYDYKNNWNGTIMGEGSIVEEGTYFYQLQLDQEEKESGWLYIKY